MLHLLEQCILMAKQQDYFVNVKSICIAGHLQPDKTIQITSAPFLKLYLTGFMYGYSLRWLSSLFHRFAEYGTTARLLNISVPTRCFSTVRIKDKWGFYLLHLFQLTYIVTQTQYIIMMDEHFAH